MKAKALILTLLFTIPAVAVSAELGKLADAVDTDKAVESVDVEKLKGSVDGTEVDYKKAYDSVDKEKAADAVDMDKVKEALSPDMVGVWADTARRTQHNTINSEIVPAIAGLIGAAGVSRVGCL